MSRFVAPLPLFVAQRYLRSPRRDAFVTFLSLTAAGGIALGVGALILSTSALAGFQSILRQEVLLRTPHIEIVPMEGQDVQVLTARVSSSPGVMSAEPWIRGRGWILSLGQTRPVEVVGFQGTLPELFPDAAGRSPGLYVSRRLAQDWRLLEGQVVEVVSARPTLSPLGPQPRVRRLALQGTFAAARSENEERIAVPLESATQLFGEGAKRILVTCGSLDEALTVAASLSRSLGPEVRIETWRDANRALFFLLRLEKTLMFLAVFLIVVVAGMAVISDLMLILAQKQAEMGMLGAMGSRPDTLRRIFLWLGGLLVAVGCVAGGILGVGGAWLLDRYRVLSLPSDVYFVDHVPFLVRLQDVAVIFGATVALALVCSWYGASKAAALRPVEALRR